MKTLFHLIVVLIFLPLVVASAHAQNAGSIAISPLVTDLNLQAGVRSTQEIVVRNNNGDSYVITPEAFDVEIEPVSHNVRFLDRASLQNERRSLASWLELSASTFVLEPGESRKLTVFFEVPSEVEAGDYFASLNFYYVPEEVEESGSMVRVRQSIGSLFLARVNGDGQAQVSAADYEFASMELFPGEDDVTVQIEVSNNTLRYVSLKPQIILLSHSDEVQFKSVGESVRVFPGESQVVSHRFPAEYLLSQEPLLLKYQLWDHLMKKPLHEQEQELIEVSQAGVDFVGSLRPILLFLMLVMLMAIVVCSRRTARS